MGSGYWNADEYRDFSVSKGRRVDRNGISSRQNMFTSRTIDKDLDPYGVTRECCDSKDHPNSIPVILGLDVTGSMGNSCERTAQTLGVIMTDLYKSNKDIEFMVMGIGDLAYDHCPLQVSQFEADIRIAEQLDKIYLEKGGGGNGYESYTLAWYFGLFHTKLDCWKRGKKGIIITMGDEPLNPYLPGVKLFNTLGRGEETQTEDLYKQVIQKFDVYHIAVDDRENCFYGYKYSIMETFGKLLGDHLKISTIDKLHKTIVDCIRESIGEPEMLAVGTDSVEETVVSNGGISW